MAEKQKKPIFKRWWFWVIVVVVVGAIGSSMGDDGNTQKVVENDTPNQVGDAVEPVDSEPETEEPDAEEPDVEEPEEPKADVPKEHQSALKKAQIYSDTMHMSKAGIYKQLTSEHGEDFSEEAAEYAIDNVDADWNENALQKAILYQDEMAMSPNAIYDQLVSEHGEEFTAEEAQYAVDNLPE